MNKVDGSTTETLLSLARSRGAKRNPQSPNPAHISARNAWSLFATTVKEHATNARAHLLNLVGHIDNLSYHFSAERFKRFVVLLLT